MGRVGRWVEWVLTMLEIRSGIGSGSFGGLSGKKEEEKVKG